MGDGGDARPSYRSYPRMQSSSVLLASPTSMQCLHLRRLLAQSFRLPISRQVMPAFAACLDCTKGGQWLSPVGSTVQLPSRCLGFSFEARNAGSKRIGRNLRKN